MGIYNILLRVNLWICWEFMKKYLWICFLYVILHLFFNEKIDDIQEKNIHRIDGVEAAAAREIRTACERGTTRRQVNHRAGIREKRIPQLYTHRFSIASKQMDEIFDDIMDLDYFFLRLQTFFNVKLYERESVIIFDEVQFKPQARQAIKHLVADGRYDYIETGSLISIRKNVENILIPSEEMSTTLYPNGLGRILLGHCWRGCSGTNQAGLRNEEADRRCGAP